MSSQSIAASASSSSPAPSRALNISLWVAQTLIFVAFVVFGCIKMFGPIEKLASMWVWPGQVAPAFLRGMGLVDLAGGLGILLPMLTRIQPRLTVWAALGCVVLQICAIVFHVSRGEVMAIPLNVILLAICAFILWGRGKKIPVA